MLHAFVADLQSAGIALTDTDMALTDNTVARYSLRRQGKDLLVMDLTTDHVQAHVEVVPSCGPHFTGATSVRVVSAGPRASVHWDRAVHTMALVQALFEVLTRDFTLCSDMLD